MSEYILNLSKWICGGGEEESSSRLNGMGRGSACLLNQEGYMCCLGQFAEQKGVEKEDLIAQGEPVELAESISEKYDSNFVEICLYDEGEEALGFTVYRFRNTDLADALIAINDGLRTTIPEKIHKIKTLLKEHGHTLKVVMDGEQ